MRKYLRCWCRFCTKKQRVPLLGNLRWWRAITFRSTKKAKDSLSNKEQVKTKRRKIAEQGNVLSFVVVFFSLSLSSVSTAVEILTLNHDPALQKESVALLASLSNSSTNENTLSVMERKYSFSYLVSVVQAAREMAEKGAVPELVELLSSNDEELLTDLVNLASNLANQGNNHRHHLQYIIA